MSANTMEATLSELDSEYFDPREIELPSPNAIDWDHVNDVVKNQLARVETTLHNQLPTVSIRTATAPTKHLPVFVYLSLAASELANTFIVAISATEKQECVEMSADLAGEESGIVYIDFGKQVVRKNIRAILSSALEISRIIMNRSTDIAATMTDAGMEKRHE